MCRHKMGMFNEKDPGHKQKTSSVVLVTDLTKAQLVASARWISSNKCLLSRGEYRKMFYTNSFS